MQPNMEPLRHPIHDRTMVLRLIELVKKYPIVWSADREGPLSATRKKDGWDEISLQMGMSKPILVKKWRNLTHTFYRISKELKHCKDNGLGNTETIRKRWFAYEHMAFLEGVTRKKRSPVNKNPDEESTEPWKLDKLQDNISPEYLEVKQEFVEPEIAIFEPSSSSTPEPSSCHQPSHKTTPREQNPSSNASIYHTSQSTEEKRFQADAHFPLTHALDRLATKVHNLANRKRSPCAGFAETVAQELEQFDRANRLRIMGRISNLLQEEVERMHSLPRNSQSSKSSDEAEGHREA